MSRRTPSYRSSCVMSCSHQVENGWLPADAIVRPPSATSPITAPRSRTSSSRTSAGV